MKHNEWTSWLKAEWERTYFKELASFLREAYADRTIYPPKAQVFSAFENTSYRDMHAVILGQDPYHQKGQAHGMCFSVNPGIPIPASLQNIFQELRSDISCTIPNNGFLMPWAKQGVFLLNTVLTVEESRPMSHSGKGWEIFTDRVIQKINERKDPVVFMLWGAKAGQKRSMIDTSRHLVLTAAHPSPYSASNGFFGCHHFSKANEFLKANGEKTIDWQIPDL